MLRSYLTRVDQVLLKLITLGVVSLTTILSVSMSVKIVKIKDIMLSVLFLNSLATTEQGSKRPFLVQKLSFH